MTYGTGAIMAVPAHDQRDFEFARRYGLTVRPVIDTGAAMVGDGARDASATVERGAMIDSGPLTGTPADQAIAAHGGVASRRTGSASAR